MRSSRFRGVIVCPLVALLVLSAIQPGFAGVIGTEQILTEQYPDEQRSKVAAFLERDDVKAKLVTLGVAPEVAAARIASLSDAEISQIAQKIDEDPAGQSAAGAIVGALLIVFLVLLFTDIIGATDVFAFGN